MSYFFSHLTAAQKESDPFNQRTGNTFFVVEKVC